MAATAVLASSFSLWAQVDETVSFPKEFRKWATVKSVLVGPQSAAFATEGGIHHIYANDKALEGYDTGKFPDGSVIVYELLETKEVAGNTIEGPTRRVDVMPRQPHHHQKARQPLRSPTKSWGQAHFSGIFALPNSCYRGLGNPKHPRSAGLHQ